MATTKQKYYATDEIRKRDAHYNFVLGERSNGKTTALLRDILSDYHRTGRRGAIVRQMDEDIKGHKGASLFAGVVAGGMVEELTEYEWNNIRFRNRAYYLEHVDEEGEVDRKDSQPFAFIFAVSQAIHYKSNSYPNIGTIMFDEFMRQDHAYLVDEVVQFLNLVSTIVRDKADAKVFLIANTVSWNSPYFKKFGLKDVAKMKPGQIATVSYKKKRPTGTDIVMKVAIEYCRNTASYGGKASDVYFLVDDERVNMITDGTFAIPNYPRCPHHFGADNVKCTYWLPRDDESVLRGRLMKVDRDIFVFVDAVRNDVYERLRDDRRDLFYSLEFSGHPNHYIDPTRPMKDTRTVYLAQSLAASRMFFESNDVGEDFMDYTASAQKRSVTAL